MALGVKYLFRWQDRHGAEWKVEILQDGYTGAAKTRAIGGQSVTLRRDNNGGIWGTSLELSAECSMDGEYADLYTSNPFEFQVRLKCGTAILWKGYVSPELYSEPFIAPPYDVRITASDNLGELKNYKWSPVGRQSLHVMLGTLLNATGMRYDIKYISSVRAGSLTAAQFYSNVTVDWDELTDVTFYDVLDKLMQTFHAVIFQHGLSWIVMRETDVTPALSGGKVFPAGSSAGIPVASVGSAYAGGWWPEGHADLTIVPARKNVTINCEELWDRTGDATVSNPTTGNATAILDVSFDAADGINLDETNREDAFPLCVNVELGWVLSYLRSKRSYFSLVVSVTGNGITRYLVSNDDDSGVEYKWSASQGSIRITPPANPVSYAARRTSAGTSYPTSGEVFTLQLPQCDGITALTRVRVQATSNSQPSSGRPTQYYPTVHFFDAWLSYGDTYAALSDVIEIDNNARQPADNVNMLISGVTSTAEAKYFIANTLKDRSGVVVGTVESDLFAGYDYLSFIARDYALSVAAPRLKAEGTLNGVASPVVTPLFMAMGGHNFIIQEWSWDLIEGSLNMSALTLPVVSIEVSSETIIAGNEVISGSGSSGSGSSSGGSGTAAVPPIYPSTEGYIGTTRIQPAAGEQSLTGIADVTMSGNLNIAGSINIGGVGVLQVVNVGTESEPVYVLRSTLGFYSDSFVSAFGASDTGGGGGGGIDLPAMWANLQINESGTTGYGLQIDYHHLFNVAYSGTGFVTSAAWSKASGKNTLTFTRRALTASDIPSITTAKISDLETWISGKGYVSDSALSAYLPLSGGTMTGTIGMDGWDSTVMLNRNVVGTTTAGWSRNIITGTVDGITAGMFRIGFYGAYTAGASDNGITYAFLGMDGYAGLNLRIAADSLKWGTDDILHAGNYNSFAPTLTGTGASGTWDINISGTAAMASKLSTVSKTIWGVTYWSADGVPADVTGRPTLYIGTTRVQTSSASQALAGISTIAASGLATIAGGVKVTTTKKIWFGDDVYIELDSDGNLHTNAGLYSDSFVSAFGASDTGGGGGGIDLAAMWANLQINESGTTGYNLQIHSAHLTSALSGYVNSISTTGSGNAVTAVSKSGSTLTFTKGSTFALASRTITGTGYLTGGGSLAADRTIDIASTYKGYIDEGHTAYGWGNHASAGYLTSATAANTYLPLTGGTLTGVTTIKYTSQEAFAVNRSNNSIVSIGFYGRVNSVDDTQLGRIGYDTLGAWVRDASDTDYRYIYHTGNLTLATLAGTTAIGSSTNPVYYTGSAFAACNLSTTYAPYNAAGYLPLSGGTMANTTVVGSLNADLLDGQHGSYYAAAASLGNYLPLAGGTMTGSPVLSNAVYLRANNAAGTDMSILGINASDNLLVGYGTAGQGYETHVYGGSTAFHYGTARAVGMTLTSGGNIGIGVAAPTVKLQVAGAVTATGAGTFQTLTLTSTAAANHINFSRAGANYINLPTGGSLNFSVGGYGGANTMFRINANGAAVNATISTTNTFSVGGTIYASTGIYSDGYVSAFGVSSTSDERFKRDFIDTTLSVADIAHAPSITFLWKDREGRRQAGSLAQYWETVLPEVVSEHDGKKALDYGAAALVSAITIARDVNDHERRIQELERENRELKRRLGYAME